MIYALDTNTIIKYINGDANTMSRFLSTAKSKISMVIPSVVDYEVSRGFYHTPNPNKEAIYNAMRQNCPVIDVNAAIWDNAAQIWAKLRKQGITIGDADTLIAAFCNVNGYTLVTNNIKHFAGIAGLNLEDWTI